MTASWGTGIRGVEERERERSLRRERERDEASRMIVPHAHPLEQEREERGGRVRAVLSSPCLHVHPHRADPEILKHVLAVCTCIPPAQSRARRPRRPSGPGEEERKPLKKKRKSERRS